ncbi:PAS domain S-box protein, partial [Candidatus Neomarinimicrobiota bacterium]
EVILVTIRDITSRKQVEQALKDSEIKHKALINNIPGMIYRGFSDWSSEIISGAKEVCGFTNEEINLLENKWLSIIHPDDIDEVKKIGFDITKRQKAIVQIYRIINKAGLTQWVEDHKTSLFSDDGEFFGIDGIVFNVTDRKLIELALIENERRMSVMLGNLPGMVYRRQNDKNWTIDFISEGCVNITGYTPNNLINNKIESLKNLIHPDDISKVHSRIQKAIKQGTTFENEYRIIMKSGEVKIVWEHGVPIKAENQDKIFIEGYIWDVTARIKGERALKESHDRYEAIFEGVADGIVYANRKGKILAVNTGFENITGLSKENWIGKNGLDLARKYIPINKLPKLMSQIKPALKGEALKNIIFEYNDQLLEINAPMEKDTPGVTIHVRDITEQVEAQSKLEQARVDLQESHEQLHELSTHMENVREEERTSIAREIHDELGQAMTAIKMDLVWLAKTISDVHPNVIEKTTSTLKIVDDAIKSIKRISTELRPGLLDDLGLSAAIEWQVGEFQSRTGIKCDLMFQPKEIITDQARSTVLFRIMQEALTNVARHSKATRVKIRLKDDHGLLQLTIIDNGIGITDKKIIDPKSYGLKGIQERVYPWRGSVTITGTKGKGTILIAIIPKNE